MAERPPPSGGLFDGIPPAGAPARVRPAAHSPALQALGAAMPAELRMGTSSWGFPGWSELVYAQVYEDKLLSRSGLGAYAAHPLFRTVGLDRTHYQPMSAADLQAMGDQAPADFRFLVKGHEHCSLGRFPAHPRYGKRRGQDNPRCLDPAYAIDQVVGPTIEGLGPRLGVLLFQFAPQPVDDLGGTQRFPDRLFRFLDALPKGPCYAVEIRNPPLLTTPYADALAAAGAVHCLTLHGTMPNIRAQARVARTARGKDLVIRWMLNRPLNFNEATQRYFPFDRLVDENPEDRETIAKAAVAYAERGRRVWIVGNNKAEGCSPLTLVKLAKRIRELAG